jgi:hypothetical protein
MGHTSNGFTVRWILLILVFLKPIFALACIPSEIHVREQWINAYSKEDGTKVSAHLRSEHCRDIKIFNYFQDSSSKEFRNFKGKFKAWISPEKLLLNNELNKLPSWLRKYKVSNFLRASLHEGNPNNPALTFPDSKSIILFDSYFNSPDKNYILLHEISHIAIWDVDPGELQNFLVSNGWVYNRGESPKPPRKVIIPDSSHSPGEDFANSVEMYYSNPKVLKKFNHKSFLILEGIIKTKEKQ